MKKMFFYSLSILSFLLVGCTYNKTKSSIVDKQNIDMQNIIEIADQQIGYQVKIIEDSGRFLNPRTVVDGKITYVSPEDWTSGFFPGTLFYMYDLTKKNKYLDYGIKYTETLENIKYLTRHHDVGFMIFCSYGNALRLTNNEKYGDVIVQAAKSLSNRFQPGAGVIQSWDEDKGWQGKRGWSCPVIIDNMMNLELLFEATKISGDSTFWKIAVSHADNTMEHHFRNDWSCYHVVDYDKQTGVVRSKETAQGFAHESAWSRGQAWAIYGYTLCYRYTKDPKYLKIAENIYSFIFNHKNLPQDLIPYWDFDAPNIPNEPRDASAAAITASALYELAKMGQTQYKGTADKIISSLSSPFYTALVGTNGNFILMHSVGSIPHGHEIDTPINYADYYFLEALLRKNKLDSNQSLF